MGQIGNLAIEAGDYCILTGGYVIMKAAILLLLWEQFWKLGQQFWIVGMPVFTSLVILIAKENNIEKNIDSHTLTMSLY